MLAGALESWEQQGRLSPLPKQYGASFLFYQNYTLKIVCYSYELKLKLQLKFESEIPLRNVTKVSNYMKKTLKRKPSEITSCHVALLTSCHVAL